MFGRSAVQSIKILPGLQLVPPPPPREQGRASGLGLLAASTAERGELELKEAREGNYSLCLLSLSAWVLCGIL